MTILFDSCKRRHLAPDPPRPTCQHLLNAAKVVLRRKGLAGCLHPPPFQRARELRNGAMIASENRCVARCSSSTRILSPIATRRRPRCTDQRSLPGLSSPSSRRCAPSSGLWLVHLRGRENGWRRWWWSAPSTSDRETWRSRSPSEQRSHSSRGPVERNRCKC